MVLSANISHISSLLITAQFIIIFYIPIKLSIYLNMKCEPVFYKFIGMWRLYAYLRNMLLWILGNVKVVWSVGERNTCSVSALINRNAIISKGKATDIPEIRSQTDRPLLSNTITRIKGSVSHSRIYIAYKWLIKLIQFQTEKRDAKVIMNCGYQLVCWKEIYAAYLTLWSRSSSKCYLRIQSVPQREHHTSPLQRSTG
jgi:hypothetical protein